MDERGVDDLLTAYERGKISRRQMLAAMAMLAQAAGLAAGQGEAAQAAASLRGRARSINHINIRVSDTVKSAAFYNKLGLPGTLRPITPPFPGGAAFAADFKDGSFISLIRYEKERAGAIDHFCIGLDNFDVKRDFEAIKAMGIPVQGPEQLGSGLGNSIICRDPDGVSVQITDAKEIFDCPMGIGKAPCDIKI